ncbi:MAG: hypothetical protein ACQ9MH_02935 [Nitrospinales bacterium]
MKIFLTLVFISIFLLTGFAVTSNAQADSEKNKNLSAHYEELDQIAKETLHNFFLACKSFWFENGGGKTCTLNTASQKKYNFEIPDGISIRGEGADDNFHALAYHKRSIHVFRINSEGSIVENLSL